MIQHSNARDAIRHAAAFAPAVVGWKTGGWIVYTPMSEAPDGVEPEILVLMQGGAPMPLSDIGADVLRSALAASVA